MTENKEKHDLMVSKFIDYLENEKITNYSVEFPIPTDKINPDFVDVVVFNWDKMFLFEIKSGSANFSDNIQQMRKYIFLLRKVPRYKWRDISGFLVFNSSFKDNVIKFKSLFKDVDILILDKDNNSIVELNSNKELKKIIKSIGKINKIRKILSILTEEDRF